VSDAIDDGGRVRRAGVEDAAALVSLRAVMFEAMGVDVDPGDAWRATAEEWFARRLEDEAGFAAFVVEDATLGVVSGACGEYEQRAPRPGDTRSGRGHVFNVATDPRRRRRGHSRACLGALLGWFVEETDARAVELSASEDGLPLICGARVRGAKRTPHAPLLGARSNRGHVIATSEEDGRKSGLLTVSVTRSHLRHGSVALP
jgi:GNAT superfamily N-acetyltransferase